MFRLRTLHRRTWIALGACALLAATFAAYSNSFRVPPQFDDEFALAGNASLHHLRTAWSPPAGTTVAGRPVLNLSFALNYALGGDRVAGYHAVNLLIHLLAAWTLWGIVARTLRARGRSKGAAQRLGWGVALLWALHPLQTEAVTYLSQRAESLMGWFYLLTLYAFIRGCASPRPRRWWILSCVACFLGMGSKEVMVSAPLLVLLYDRTFIAGSFGAAWRNRRGLYLGLAATWLPLAYWVVSLGGTRGGSTGFGAGVSWGHYILTQFPALAHYLRLVFWPHPLVFEYGPVPVPQLVDLPAPALLVLSLLILTAVGLSRRSPWSFLGAWFFAVLAPTSLVPGAIQMFSEHRMYLASAAVICLAVLAVDFALARWKVSGTPGIEGWALAIVAGGLGALTFARNQDYRSALSLWSATVAQRPAHALARYNLANELAKRPDGAAEALRQYGEALKLNPRLMLAHYNLAVLLEQLPGRQLEAADHYRQAVEIDPGYLAAQNNLATVLARLGRPAEAALHYEAALRLEPNSSAISSNLGSTLVMCGRYAEAVEPYRKALRLNPADSATRGYLVWTLQKLGRNAEAQACSAEVTGRPR